jgi:hypothetical protein
MFSPPDAAVMARQLTRPATGLSTRDEAGVQARRCLDERADEAWQIGNDPSPNDPSGGASPHKQLSFARQILTVRLWLMQGMLQRNQCFRDRVSNRGMASIQF